MVEIKISDIRLDGGTQTRAIKDEYTIDTYSEAMQSGQQFPPIDVFYDGTDYWLADGFHRVDAAKKASITAFECTLHQGTRRDAVLFSVGVNATHGLPRKNADKRRAIMTLLNDDEWSQWSNSEIARRCKVNDKTVAKYRSKVTSDFRSEKKYTTKHGTVATMDTTNIGSEPSIKPALPDDAEPYLHEMVDTGKVSVEDATQVDHALKNGAPEPVKEGIIKHNLVNPKQVEAITEAYNRDPRFVEETLERGAVVNLDGDDVPIQEADPTLLRIAAHENEYERIKRQETYISEKQKKKILAIGSSESNEWYTPAKYIESAKVVLGQFDVDPASNDMAQKTIQAKQHYTIETNGLDKDWHGKVWLNPPYGTECPKFIEKLMQEVQSGHTTEAIALVNSHATDTNWFQPLWDYTLCFTNHRINFISPDETSPKSGSNHGSIFVYVGSNQTAFSQEFSQYGAIVARYVPTVAVRAA